MLSAAFCSMSSLSRDELVLIAIRRRPVQILLNDFNLDGDQWDKRQKKVQRLDDNYG